MQPIIAHFADMMPFEVTVERYAKNGFGEEGALVSSQTIRCRITLKRHKVKNAQGKQVQANGTCTLLGVYGVKETDKLILPSSFAPRNPPIAAVTQSSDENGPHHEAIHFS